MKAIDATPIPTESVEQQRLFQWARAQHGKYPELNLLYHIPNEGKRSKANGRRLKAEGLKSGVPDLCLPVARCGCHGLYIELKRLKGGRVTDEQTGWMAALMQQGYMAAVCRGWETASVVILNYLRGNGGVQDGRT